MEKRDLFQKYMAADKMASRSDLIVKWMVESLESQAAKGNLSTMDEINLKMGKSFLSDLETYLTTGVA